MGRGGAHKCKMGFQRLGLVFSLDTETATTFSDYSPWASLGAPLVKPPFLQAHCACKMVSQLSPFLHAHCACKMKNPFVSGAAIFTGALCL